MKRSKRSGKMLMRIGNRTVNRMNLEKPMGEEMIAKINSRLEAQANQDGICREKTALRDWQREIMKK